MDKIEEPPEHPQVNWMYSRDNAKTYLEWLDELATWQDRRMDQIAQIPAGILREEEKRGLITGLANARDRLVDRREEICAVWFQNEPA